jgi:hypothetical protein
MRQARLTQLRLVPWAVIEFAHLGVVGAPHPCAAAPFVFNPPRLDYARELQSGKAVVMRLTQAPHNTGDTVRDVLEYYRCYLPRNRDLADHSTQFLKRENSDPKAAEAEAVVSSWLREESVDVSYAAGWVLTEEG